MHAVPSLAILSSSLTALCLLAGCGGDSSAVSGPQRQDKAYTNQDALNQIEAELKKNMAEVDADPKLSPQEKEATKKMMRETVDKRAASFKE